MQKNLPTYCRNTVDEIVQKAKDIPEDKKSESIMQKGQMACKLILQDHDIQSFWTIVGAINVADVGDKGGAGMSRSVFRTSAQVGSGYDYLMEPRARWLF